MVNQYYVALHKVICMSDNGTKFSIITIGFNDKVGLEKTIGSVVNQEYPNVEYIVIDGASTDGSKELLEENSSKINYWVSEPDKGIYDAMNKGIKHATGDYVLFLNSGDLFLHSQTLSVIATVVGARPNIDVFHGKCVYTDFDNQFTMETPEVWFNLKTALVSALPHQSTYYKRSGFSTNGNFDASYKILGDQAWNVAGLKKGLKFHYVNCHTSICTLGGISTNLKHRESENKKIIRDNYTKSEFISAWSYNVLKYIWRRDKFVISYLFRLTNYS